MYRTLSERLTQVSDDTVLFPGHHYSRERSLALGEVRARNNVFAASSLVEWLAMFNS